MYFCTEAEYHCIPVKSSTPALPSWSRMDSVLLNLTAECFNTHSSSWGCTGRSCGQSTPLLGADRKMGWDGSRSKMKKAWDFARCWVALLQILVWIMPFCLLVKDTRSSQQPLLVPLQWEERFCWGTAAPNSLPKENRPGVFQLVCRAVGQHEICSSQDGMHGGVWRERMFGCKGFVYARSLAG